MFKEYMSEEIQQGENKFYEGFMQDFRENFIFNFGDKHYKFTRIPWFCEFVQVRKMLVFRTRFFFEEILKQFKEEMKQYDDLHQMVIKLGPMFDYHRGDEINLPEFE